MTAAVQLAPVPCAHCGTPCAAVDDGLAFCCQGCAVVYQTLARCDLGRYYALRDPATAAPAHASGRSYAEYDDPAFAAAHVRGLSDGRAEVALYLEDLRCAACIWLLERMPQTLPGVVQVRLDIGRARADVVFAPGEVRLSAIAQQFERLGHPVHPFRGTDRDAARRREDRALLIKLGVAGAAVGNLMLLGIALYAGIFASISVGDEAFFRWASMVVAVPALGFAGTPVFRTAIGAVRAGQMHLDLPLALAIGVGLAWGSINVLRGVGEIYFDSLAMLVFLILATRWLMLRQQRRASLAAELLHALAPRVVSRLCGPALDSNDAEVPMEAIRVGDLLRVRAGETIAVDGVIRAGLASVQTSTLTGESVPREVGVGDRVMAGTVNQSGLLVVEAQAVGEATRLGQLVEALARLSAAKAPIQRYVDTIAARFVLVVLTATLITLALWAHAGARTAMEHAMAMLIVTCPCALALATPLAVGLALGRAARRGMLIKGADALERLATPGTLFIDKTGTLTEGALSVASWRGDVDVRPWVAALERGSSHPMARALAQLADPGVAVADVVQVQGGGISGRVRGRTLAIGSPRWIRTLALVDAAAEAWIGAAAEAGESPVAVAVDGQVVAVAGLIDALRPEAKATLDLLRGAGWRVRLLSGDDPRVVAQVAAAVGCAPADALGGQSPEDKVAAVQAVTGTGGIAVMVGDGVNDAAALAAATAGIAVQGGAEVAIEAADVYVARGGLGAVVELHRGARATLQTIRAALRVSLAYNLTSGALAMAGLIHPMIAAIVMPLSSGTVLLMAIASPAFRGRVQGGS